MLDTSSPLLKTSLYPEAKKQFAWRRLRAAIIDCELQPGSVFSEAEIADRFNLGRAAVRSALAQLEMTGLIVAQARNGWHVPVISGAAVGDLITARLALEPQLVQVSIPADVIVQLRSLAVQIGALSLAQSAEAIATVRAADQAFMQLLAQQSGALVAAWYGDLHDRMARFLSYFEKDRPVFVAQQREELVDAFECGDVSAAVTILCAEIGRYRDYIIDRLLRSETMVSVAPERPAADSSGAKRVSQRRTNVISNSSSAPKGNKL